MNNEEIHEKTIEVLAQLVPVLNCDDLALLCWHCGVKTNELMPIESSGFPAPVSPVSTTGEMKWDS